MSERLGAEGLLRWSTSGLEVWERELPNWAFWSHGTSDEGKGFLSSLGSFAGSKRCDQLSRTVTLELWKHVTMGRSHDQTRSPSHDPVPNPVSKESCDKEREHDLMHAYFCRCNLCYVHDRY